MLSPVSSHPYHTASAACVCTVYIRRAVYLQCRDLRDAVPQAAIGDQGGLPALASRVAALREEQAALSDEVARLAASNAKYEQVNFTYWHAVYTQACRMYAYWHWATV